MSNFIYSHPGEIPVGSAGANGILEDNRGYVQDEEPFRPFHLSAQPAIEFFNLTPSQAENLSSEQKKALMLLLWEVEDAIDESNSYVNVDADSDIYRRTPDHIKERELAWIADGTMEESLQKRLTLELNERLDIVELILRRNFRTIFSLSKEYDKRLEREVRELEEEPDHAMERNARVGEQILRQDVEV